VWSQPTSESAAKLCAVIWAQKNYDLTQKRCGCRFFMGIDQARMSLNLTRAQFLRVLEHAVDSDWICLSGDWITLKAAGIYVAKEFLDLPH
jgi:hypothetical protein